MRLAKIKNSYMFRSDNPNGTHTYAVFYDRRNRQYNAVQLTHLYVKDDDRFRQVRRGNIKVMKFKEFDVPSGVRNSYYNKNVLGGKIDLLDSSNVVRVFRRYLSKNQSDSIKAFARNVQR